MKLIKTLLVASSIVLASISAQAAEKTTAKQNTPAKQQTNTQLKSFNDSIKIIPVSRSTGQDKAGKSYAVVQYNLENTNKKPIKSVTWIAAYGVGNTILYSQQIPVKFDKPLAKGAKMNVTVTIPFTSLTPQAQAAFQDSKAALRPLTIAREIVFSNGSKIQVKD